jgi:hypothetical protein
MKQILTLILLLSAAQAKDFYVGPNGSALGNGSAAAPWNLSTALLASSIVQSGDTIWIRGGTYTGAFTCTLLGSASAPIVVRNFQNEQVILDGSLVGQAVTNTPTLLMWTGGYVWFWGLEITNSDPNRWSPIPGSNPPTGRAIGTDIRAPGVKLINSVIHDTGQGISAWAAAPDFEAYGNVVFNNGWESTDRGHGHGIYTQNNTGTKLFKNNVVLHQFGNAVNLYGSSAAYLRDITFDGNSFLNAIQQYGGNTPTENFTYVNNRSYNTAPQFGYGAPSSGLLCANNYLARGLFLNSYTGAVTVQNNTIYQQLNDGQAKLVGVVLPTGVTLANYTFDSNTYYQSSKNANDYWASGAGFTFAGWQQQGEDAHSVYLPTTGPNYRPTGTKVFFTANAYDPQKASITVFNWDKLNTVAVDPSAVLAPGDKYELRSAEDYFNDVVTGSYAGGSLTIPMTNHTLALPLGYATALGPTGFPEYGVFLLTKVNTSTTVILSGAQTSAVTANSATVSWTTNVPTNALVEYGRTTAYGNSLPLDPAMVTSHSELLAGLADGVTYHYRITSANAKGQYAVSADQTFATPDVTPPVISGVAAGAITFTSATIQWTTNEPSDSQVEYGPTTSYGSATAVNSALITAHQVTIAGLSGTTIYYRVRSRDASGNPTVSAGFSFVLPSLTISNVLATATSTTSATIAWTTNLPSDTRVDFGSTATYGSKMPVNATLVTSHVATLTGLTGSALYFRVSSTASPVTVSATGGPISLAPTVTLRIPALPSDGRLSFWGPMNSGCTLSTWKAAWSALSGEVDAANAIRANFVASGCIGAGSIGLARGFLAFDTRAIPAGAQIVGAKLALYVTAKLDDVKDGNDFISVVQGRQASPTALTLSDYPKAGNQLQGATEGAARVGLSNVPLNAYTTWNLNASGLAWVTKGGYTQLALREGHDLLNIWPNYGSGKGVALTVVMSESATPSQTPYLEITYR